MIVFPVLKEEIPDIFFNISPNNKVVVVFPLLPVIATIFALVYLNANSTSDIIGIF